MVNSFLQPFFSLLGRLNTQFSECILCGSHNLSQSGQHIDICAPCQATLPTIDHCCDRCALPLPKHSEPTICGQCLQKPPRWTQAHALWYYETPVAELLTALKYQRQYSYARSLALMACDKLGRAYPINQKPDLICATPLHYWRYWQRGFNQSMVLSQYISHAMQIIK